MKKWTIILIICLILSNFLYSDTLFADKYIDIKNNNVYFEILDKINLLGNQNPEVRIKLANQILKKSYSEKNKNMELKALNLIGLAYLDLKDYGRANENFFNALNLMTKSDDDTIHSKLLINIGNTFFFMDSLDRAIDYYENSLVIINKSNNPSEKIIALNNLGHLYSKLGRYDKSFENLFELLKIYEKQKFSDKITDVLLRISNNYVDLEKYDDAIKFAKKSVKNERKLNNLSRLARALVTVGNIYQKQNDINSALGYYLEAYEYIKDQNTRMKAVLLNNIGLIQKHFGKYREAFDYIKQSIDIYELLGDEQMLFYPHTSLAELSMRQGKYFNAIEYLKSALKIASNYEDINQLHNTYMLLYDSYKHLEKSDSALKYFENALMLKDSIANSELSFIIENTKVKYETEHKEAENKLLKQQNIIQKISFFVITSLIFILLLLLFAKYKGKQTANKKLNEKNEKISNQHNELQSMYEQLQKREEDLREANATKDKFFSIIAHDLKNPIHAITLSSDLLINKFKYMDAEQLVEVVQNINKSGNHLSTLLTNLLEWSRAKTSSISFHLDKLELHIAVQSNIDLLNFNANKKDIKLINNVPIRTIIPADINMLDTILRNLISNAIKFTPKHGQVIIKSELKDDLLQIIVQDSGIGIKEVDMQKLFRIDVHHTTKGTSNEQGTGLGLLLCKEFAERHGGNIFVESEFGKGSTFIVNLPYYELNKIVKKRYGGI